MLFNRLFIKSKPDTVDAIRVAELIPVFLLKELSATQRTILLNWLQQGEANRMLFIELTDAVQLELIIVRLEQFNAGNAWRRLIQSHRSVG